MIVKRDLGADLCPNKNLIPFEQSTGPFLTERYARRTRCQPASSGRRLLAEPAGQHKPGRDALRRRPDLADERASCHQGHAGAPILRSSVIGTAVAQV